MTLLDQLRDMTTVVADTGDIDSIARLKPQDATTNPSLILQAAQMPQYAELIERSLDDSGLRGGGDDAAIARCVDQLAVSFGTEILRHIPGRVSTEVDARLSFDTQATIDRARGLIALYEQRGIARERILIKIASTWEGIRAAEQLEREGIACNLTLLFGFGQAVACADARVTLISPFVGRIYDWYRKDRGVDHIEPADDPGVHSVTRIFNHYKTHGIATEVMGASFRNSGQIIELAGCDLLTISPKLLDELATLEGTLQRRLDAQSVSSDDPRQPLDENAFRWALNEDAMATEKLAQGIRSFAADLDKLIAMLRQRAG